MDFMKRLIFLALLPFSALLGVTGCDDTYSHAVRYTFRTDPVLIDKPGDEVNFDPPGRFPIRSAASFLDERNPYFAMNKKEDLVKSGKPRFRDPHMIPRKIAGISSRFWMTPLALQALPIVSDLTPQQRDSLKLDEETLEKGSRLYRVHCLHCHGVTGNGRGPTASWLNPHPRDYRQGRFKFTSVDQTKLRKPPHRDDLLRVLEHGIEGTAMPSFGLLQPAEREALVSYVIHLSIRGKTEFDTILLAYEFSSKDNKLTLTEVPSLTKILTRFFETNVQKLGRRRSRQKSTCRPIPTAETCPIRRSRRSLLPRSSAWRRSTRTRRWAKTPA